VLPRVAAITTPIAILAPSRNPALIAKERMRFCFAGAIAAPAGLDPDVPCRT
jgi:hypothetical protein